MTHCFYCCLVLLLVCGHFVGLLFLCCLCCMLLGLLFVGDLLVLLVVFCVLFGVLAG